MIVTVCTFKRRPRDKWEAGIAIGQGPDDITTVVDKEGNRVNILSDYKVMPQAGCFIADLELGNDSSPARQTVPPHGDSL